MAIRLSDINEKEMFGNAIRLSDIPDNPMTPDEALALANRELDYADRENISLRAAREQVQKEVYDENVRANLSEVNKVFKTDFNTFVPGKQQSFTRTTEQMMFDEFGIGSPNEFTTGEKTLDIIKAGHRGLGNIVKMPGVALKALGEAPATRTELSREKWNSPSVKAHRAAFDMIRRVGNGYIEWANNQMFEASPEAMAQMDQPFRAAPFFRTGMAVAESAPSYAASVVATLSTGNPWAGLTIMGSTTASAEYENLRSQGVDPDLAMAGAIVAGSIEVVTEKLPMDELLKGAGRPLLIRALRLGTFESFQELLAQLGQNYENAFIQDINAGKTTLDAVRQEWSIIANGWQDAMAAGFIMGGGAAMFSGEGPDVGRDTEELMAAYGQMPRNDSDFLAKLAQVRQEVKKASEVTQEAETPAEGTVAGVQETTAQGEPQAGGEETTQQRAVKTFYRGTVKGETKRIDEPFTAAKGKTFVATTEKEALNYGDTIETITSKPDAKILEEGSPEFGEVVGIENYNPELDIMNQRDGSYVDVINDAIRKAESSGYDAVSFKKNVGTIIFNESAFNRQQPTGKETLFAEMETPEKKTENTITVSGGIPTKVEGRAVTKANKSRKDQYIWQDSQGGWHVTQSQPEKYRAKRIRPQYTAAEKRAQKKAEVEANENMDPKRRRSLRKRFKQLIQNSPAYKATSEAMSAQSERVLSYLSGKYYFTPDVQGDVKGYLEGRPYMRKYVSFDKGSGVTYDDAYNEFHEATGIGPDNVGPTEFLEMIENAVTSGVEDSGLNRLGTEEFINSSDENALVAVIYDMLSQENGASEQDVVDEINRLFTDLNLEGDPGIIIDKFLSGELFDGSNQATTETMEQGEAGPVSPESPEGAQEDTGEEETGEIKEDDDFSDVFSDFMKEETPPQESKSFLERNLTPEENTELQNLEKQLADKLKNQLNIGLDPETFILATRVGSLYIKAGFRGFAQWAAKVRERIGNVSDYTLRTIYANLRNEYSDLDTDEQIDRAILEKSLVDIGTGNEVASQLPQSTLSIAIANGLVNEEESDGETLTTHRKMVMEEQAKKYAMLIDQDIERVKRIAFGQEEAPVGLFRGGAYTALTIYAVMNGDAQLIMDLATSETASLAATKAGREVKSYDTGMNLADPIRAIKDVIEARKEQAQRKGKDISALDAELRELQQKFDRAQRQLDEYMKKNQPRARREYGSRNKLVSRTEYDNILARRKKLGLMDFIKSEGGYAPNAQDLADMLKIGLFHLEALGRDIAKWNWQMTQDFGKWIEPYLEDTYNKVITEAEKKAKLSGVKIKESKRLTAKKKRMATATEKAEGKLDTLDLEKMPRFPIELDEEGKRLQAEYDLARAKLKTAQKVANIITEDEVRIITQLAGEIKAKQDVMENSERRRDGEPATQAEMEYGIAVAMFAEYVNDLKAEANKKTIKELIKNYLANPSDFLSDLFGTLKSAKSSLDNSFHFRQGLPTFLKGLTGDVESAKTWLKTFMRSWRIMWDTLGGKKAMQSVFAEIISDPEYDLLKRSKVAIFSIEEEIPVDIPSRIPLFGVLFRMGENAFVGSAHYMRYQIAKQYLKVWRKSGIELDKRQLESIGRLANSQTGRGETASSGKTPGLLNNVFWSPRNLRAYVDILTVHAFDRNISAFARYQAAKNLLRYISGAAMILALANWIDDDSVTADPTNADFGKIKIGNTRFAVGGGISPLIVLAWRLKTRSFTSSTTGEKKSIDSGKYGALTGKDLVFNFLENKASPGAQIILSLIDQKTWDGDKLSIPQMASDAFTPLLIQNVLESGNVEDSANIIAVLIAEGLGVNVQSYTPKQPKSKQKRRSVWD